MNVELLDGDNAADRVVRVETLDITSMFFMDGKTRVEFIITYFPGSPHPESRQRYFRNLIDMGIQLEETGVSGLANTNLPPKLVFVKVHVPMELILSYAELLNFNLPVAPKDHWKRVPMVEVHRTCTWEDSMKRMFLPAQERALKMVPRDAYGRLVLRLESQGLFNPYPCHVADPPYSDYYTVPYRRDWKEEFAEEMLGDHFLSSAQRLVIVSEILIKVTDVDPTSKAPGKTLLQLSENGVFHCYYGLHDCTLKNRFVPTEKLREVPKDKLDAERRILYENWACLSAMRQSQPLHMVRGYFGEKITFYFAWLGFYTCYLIPAALMGGFVMAYSFTEAGRSELVKDACFEREYLKHLSDYMEIPDITSDLMCPECVKCPIDTIQEAACESTQLTAYFDNYSTAIYAVFIACWAKLFVLFWKREQQALACDWGVMDFEESSSVINPDCEDACSYYVLNQETDRWEPKLSFCQSFVRTVIVGIGMVVAVSIVLICCAMLIFYSMASKFYGLDVMNYDTAESFTNWSSNLLTLIVIQILNFLYEGFCKILTDIELPRTIEDYERSFAIKQVIFEIVNSFSMMLYGSFLKGRRLDHVGKPIHIFGMDLEPCESDNCFYDVAYTLMYVMIGEQLNERFMEVRKPVCEYLKTKWEKFWFKGQDDPVLRPRWEEDYMLEEYTSHNLLNEEYKSQLVQFAFCSFFVASFPLAPLLAFVNNLFAIRIDAHKYACLYRRPIPHRAKNIGLWMAVLEMMASLCGVVNSFLIAFTSTTVDKLWYQYKKGTLKGFFFFRMTKIKFADYADYAFPTNWDENSTECWYTGYRDFPLADTGNTYPLSGSFWSITAMKLLFVLVFQYFVFFLVLVCRQLIPSFPNSMQVRLVRETELNRKILQKAAAKVRNELTASLDAADAKPRAEAAADKSRSDSSSGSVVIAMKDSKSVPPSTL